MNQFVFIVSAEYYEKAKELIEKLPVTFLEDRFFNGQYCVRLECKSVGIAVRSAITLIEAIGTHSMFI